MTGTERYIEVLTCLKTGELGLLRTHAGRGLDDSVDGFDLFAGLWWPLRKKDQRAPRREVAWIIAKLYAFCPSRHSPGDTLARQLARCQPNEQRARERYRQKFDSMLILPLDRIEPGLQWTLDRLGSRSGTLDWVQLLDDLSLWDTAYNPHDTRQKHRLNSHSYTFRCDAIHRSPRELWACEYLNSSNNQPQGASHVD